MNILLTNDDGITAPGIGAAYKALSKIADVTVAAPAGKMSAAGHSITVYEPLSCKKIRVHDTFDGFSVEGSPADCVKLAVLELCDKKPDLVVSGINNGSNVGINVYYSGTVAAAMEAAFYGLPAVAVSMACQENMDFDAAAQEAVRIIEKIKTEKFSGVININIPKPAKAGPKGVKIVPQSTMGFHEHYAKQTQPDGTTVYQLTGGGHKDKKETVDTIALTDGYITVTTLGDDMTDYKNLERLRQLF